MSGNYHLKELRCPSCGHTDEWPRFEMLSFRFNRWLCPMAFCQSEFTPADVTIQDIIIEHNSVPECLLEN